MWLAMLPHVSPAATLTETFDSFGCSGQWQYDSSGPNASMKRDCGNGWTAYAEDRLHEMVAEKAG